ncbi:MAG: DNA-deoxyinosine glycosylase [Bacteroidota bacterium]|nr:DNA-deoxyinosine glycosylase [Bacteroidota bacterium]
MQIFSFPPISNADSKILILGTMPGNDSLKMNQYYAHPRNAFWKIMFAIFDQPFSNDYSVKKELLLNNQIALWDVLKVCERKGSLDVNIIEEETNNFKDFFEKHAHINHIFFNGQQSSNYFLKNQQAAIPSIKLPSTSPAHTMSFKEKLTAWTVINMQLKK